MSCEFTFSPTCANLSVRNTVALTQFRNESKIKKPPPNANLCIPKTHIPPYVLILSPTPYSRVPVGCVSSLKEKLPPKVTCKLTIFNILIFVRTRKNSEKCLLSSLYLSDCLCLSIHPSSPRGIPWTDSRELFYWELLRKSAQEIQICLKSDKNISHFTWRPMHVYIVDSSTKYLEARQQSKENQF